MTSPHPESEPDPTNQFRPTILPMRSEQKLSIHFRNIPECPKIGCSTN